MESEMSLTLLFIGMAIAADSPVEHPLANAKVGDAVIYKMWIPSSGGGGGHGQGKDTRKDTTLRKSISAKTADSVTVKSATTIGDMQMPAQSITFNLKQKYDQLLVASPKGPADPQTESKVVGEGDEKVTIGDKTYECHWTNYETTSKVGKTPQTMYTKIWISKSVPVDGLVKLETSKMVMELVAVENGK